MGTSQTNNMRYVEHEGHGQTTKNEIMGFGDKNNKNSENCWMKELMNIEEIFDKTEYWEQLVNI